MGRRRIPTHKKKIQCSVSLPLSVVEEIDSMTSRRSQWIHTAIQQRIDQSNDIQEASLKQLLGLATTSRFQSLMTAQEWAILDSIYRRLI